jgi:NRPS condensation-like uncharacterized protein
LTACPRAKFAVADELTCYYDRPAEPANVHVEAQATGALDASLVRAAVAAVLTAEPALRARQAPTGNWRSSYYWEFPPVTDTEPVQVRAYRDDAELAGRRAEFLSQSPSLRTSPPVRFLLATGPRGDRLVLNAHHACFDGLSALRLLRCVAAEYSTLTGESPVPAMHPARPRETGNADGPVLPPRAGSGRIIRIAGAADGRAPGYGAVQVAWAGLPAVAEYLKAAGCSVNDLLVAALIVTIQDWNASHGGGSGLIQITMPVGDPAQATAEGQWANRSRLTKVTSRPRQGDTVAALLPEVAAQTRYAKVHDNGQVDLLSLLLTRAPVPVTVKRLSLRAMLRVLGPICCDTSLISNLGVVTPVRFGTAGDTYVWFSTSAHLPRGLSVGAVTTEGTLRLTFRYRRALLTEAAAAAFAASYLAVLETTGLDAAARRSAVTR